MLDTLGHVLLVMSSFQNLLFIKWGHLFLSQVFEIEVS